MNDMARSGTFIRPLGIRYLPKAVFAHCSTVRANSRLLARRVIPNSKNSPSKNFSTRDVRVKRTVRSVLQSALLLWTVPLAAQGPQADLIVITNITVVDVTEGQSKPDMTVVIRDGRIGSITPSTKPLIVP